MDLEPGTVINAALIWDTLSGELFVLNIGSKTFKRHRFQQDHELPEREDSKLSERASATTPEAHCGLPHITSQLESAGRSEDLGEREIEGITCRGIRKTGRKSMIEFWYSEELMEVVLEKRVSEQEESTYRLFDIRRIEPNRSLFAVPLDYEEEPQESD